ncbi:MAG: FG-GAP-like repeat-containing protein [Acidimicrobiales bacterium]|nr:FG-GAP-like repeat-containing protein [Acidimicrobiales bacterium]
MVLFVDAENGEMGRAIRLIAVSSLLAVGFVVVPPPAVVWASELETETTEVDLDPVTDVEAEAAEAEVEAADAASGQGPDDEGHDDQGPGDQGADAHDHDHEGATLGTEDRATEPFTAIGVTTSRRSDTPVRVRVADGEGWGPWRPLLHVEDHSPDGDEGAAARPGYTSEPLFVGRADAYELQAPDDAGEVSVHLVTEVERRRRVVDGTAEADGAPTIRSRSSWGARSPKAPPADAGELKLAVVHHSVNSNGYAASQVPAMLRSIQAYHMDAHGWNDIAYNFAVDRYGSVWEARAGGIDRAIIGGHAFGFNTASTGVVVLGDYSSASPTAASLNAVEDLIAWKLAQHQTPTTGSVTYRSSTDTHFGPEGTAVRVNRISGHRDVRTTGCPGDALYAHLGSIRRDVAAKTPGAQFDAVAEIVEADRSGDGRDDLLLYRPGGASDRSLIGTSGPGLASGSTAISGGYEPLTGDFDGDGRGDVFWYAPGPAADYVWYGRPGGAHRSVRTRVSGEYDPYVGDFDGDGRDDIFWYGPYGGSDYVWFGQTSGFADSARRVSGGYEVHIGDFDGDGRDDIFWYGPGQSRGDYVWYGRTSRSFRSVRTSVAGYYRVQVGDFTGDGRDDLFWYRPGSGRDYLWPGRASRGFSSIIRSVSGVYDPVVGDFDGNGYDDILWNASSGRDYLWAHETGGYTDVSFDLGVGHRLVALDADGNGDDELFSLDGRLNGRLWNAGSNGFTSRSVP